MLVVDVPYNDEVDLAQYLAEVADVLQELHRKYGSIAVLIGDSLRRAIWDGHDRLVEMGGASEKFEQLVIWRALNPPSPAWSGSPCSQRVVGLNQVRKAIQLLANLLHSATAGVAAAETAKTRGRPSSISTDAKIRALAAYGRGASNRECAQELYTTKYPTAKQKSSARGILRYFAQRNPQLQHKSPEFARAFERLGVAVSNVEPDGAPAKAASPRLSSNVRAG